MSWSTWNMPKIDKKTRDKTQPEARGSKTLYEASAIAQEKEVFPKTASQAVKIIISSLNKILRITAYANHFIKNLKKINTAEECPQPTKLKRQTLHG